MTPQRDLLRLFRPALAAALFATPGLAQDQPFNARLVGFSSPGAGAYADVWGHDGIAFVGRFMTNAVHLVDVSNPATPLPLSTYVIPSPNEGASAQDVKTATLNGADLLFIGMEFNDPHGVQIVDVRNPLLPTLLTNIDTEPGNFEEIHNIFIEGGWLYMDNSSDNSISILDLRTYDADNPPASIGSWTYRLNNVGGQFVHDVTVQDGRLYASAWNSLQVFDVSGIASGPPVHLGKHFGLSTHAAWATDDGQFVVTSEERAGGGLRLFEIEDLGGSILLHQRDSWCQPPDKAFSTHNPLIIGDRVYTSWYHSGGLVLEIDRSTKSWEVVASYDTSIVTPPVTFNGNWGMYPYLGEDRVLLSDLETGLYVVDYSAIQISFPNGRPLIVQPGKPAAIVVDLKEIGVSEVDPGTVMLHARKGAAVFDRTMEALGGGRYRGLLPSATCGEAIEYWVTVDDLEARTFADPALAPASVHETYAAFGMQDVLSDDFEVDLGWTVSGDAVRGHWTRDVPVETGAQPGAGDPDDGGTACAFTGQGTQGASIGQADVDGGQTTLTSPVLDFSGGDGVVRYSTWFFNDDLDADSLAVEVTSNGSTWVPVESFTERSGGWVKSAWRVSDYVTPSATVQVRFRAEDQGSESLTEAGLDGFQAFSFDCTSPFIHNKGPGRRP